MPSFASSPVSALTWNCGPGLAIGHGRPWAGGNCCLQPDTSGASGGTMSSVHGSPPPKPLPAPHTSAPSATPSQSLSNPSQTSGDGDTHCTQPTPSTHTTSHSSSASIPPLHSIAVLSSHVIVPSTHTSPLEELMAPVVSSPVVV